MAASPDPPQVRLQKLYSLVGSDSVLLPIPFGKKHPDFEKWQKVNFAQSSSAAYEEELLKCFERGGNLGVLLGPASGDLVTIDIDRDDHLASFLGLNPALRETLRSRAKRGCQLWLRMADEYPEVVYRLKSADGLKAGEWRGGGDKGAQSVIYGRHPEKNGKGQPIDYKIVVAKPPILVMFGDIVWPQWLARPLPWEKPPTPPPPPSDKKERASEDNLDKRIRAYLATIPPAESGNGGHDQTFKVANLLIHGWALSIDKARPYLRGYSALCKPPWSEKELEHKLSEAAKATPVKPRGSLRDAVAPSAAAVGQTTRPNVTHATPPPVTDSRGQSPAAPQPADPLEKIVAALEFYYDSERSRFLVKNDVRDWMAVNAGDVRRRLKGAGYSPYKQPGEKLSQVDKLLNAIQHYGHVEYAGNLAGFQKGPYTIGEKRILVLESPRLIEPEGGDYSTLSSVLTKMWGQTQLIYLFGWLKAAIESLRARSWRPGQALVLCGPRDCGKSLCQELFTLLLGGRSAKPHRYMSQQTPFNGDLVGAEHLMIEDEEASSDIRARRFFGARIKEITANQTQSCHAKYRPAITLTPFWRLSISINDEPENLLILPPLDDSLADKFIMLKASYHQMPMPTVTTTQRTEFMNKLKAELPHFLENLLEWQIPDQLKSQRYGITHFHHPDVLETLTTLAPEIRLMELIDAELWNISPEPEIWTSTAAELERRLTCDWSEVKRQAASLLGHNPQACGNYLGRLRKKYPDRVDCQHTKKGNLWTIQNAS